MAWVWHPLIIIQVVCRDMGITVMSREVDLVSDVECYDKKYGWMWLVGM
jgi:hypothetical protein